MKTKTLTAVAFATLVLAACGGGGDSSNSAKPDDGNSGNISKPPVTQPGYYPLQSTPANYADGRARAFDALNEYRTSCGFNSLEQDSQLDDAAQGHAEYMSLNTVVTHDQISSNPGFTAVSAGGRITAAGFQFQSFMEVAGAGTTNSAAVPGPGIAQETSAHTDPVILAKRQIASIYHNQGVFSEKRYAGFGHQLGANLTTLPDISYFDGFSITIAEKVGSDEIDTTTAKGIRSFPCEGTTGVLPVFYPESPNPFPARNLTAQNTTPYGHPIYVASDNGSTLTIASFIIKVSGTPVPAQQINATNDVNSRVKANQVYLVPDLEFPENSRISVEMTGTDSVTGAFTKSFSFDTGTQL